jgi:hypothetical protein
VHILYGTEKRIIRDCIFQNFDDHFFIRQRIAQSVNDHLVRHINKRTVIVGYTGTGMHKNWSEIILDVAYSGETSGKALFIPSLKSSS